MKGVLVTFGVTSLPLAMRKGLPTLFAMGAISLSMVVEKFVLSVAFLGVVSLAMVVAVTVAVTVAVAVAEGLLRVLTSLLPLAELGGCWLVPLSRSLFLNSSGCVMSSSR